MVVEATDLRSKSVRLNIGQKIVFLTSKLKI